MEEVQKNIKKAIKRSCKESSIQTENFDIKNYGNYYIVTIYYLSHKYPTKAKLMFNKEGKITYRHKITENDFYPLDQSHFIYSNCYGHIIVSIDEKGITKELYSFFSKEPVEDAIAPIEDSPKLYLLNEDNKQVLFSLDKGVLFDQRCLITRDVGEFYPMKDQNVFRCIKKIDSDERLNNNEKVSTKIEFFINYDGQVITDLFDLEQVKRYPYFDYMPVSTIFNEVKEQLNKQIKLEKESKIRRKRYISYINK